MTNLGCDYLSCSRADHRAYAKFEALLVRHWQQETAKKRQPKQVYRLAYYGTATQHSFIGRRDDGMFFQVSGDLAKKVALDAIEMAENTSRIDLQVTIKAVDSPQALIGRCYNEAVAAPPRRGRKPSVKYIGGQHGFETVYIGSPASDERGRIYDKGLESKDAAYDGYVRFEVQFRNKRAQEVARVLRYSPIPYSDMAQIIRQWYNARGVTVPDILLSDIEVVPHESKKGTAEATLAWLATQVGPSIRNLLGEVGPYQVAVALSQNLKEIVPYNALVWGIVQAYRNYTNEGETYAYAAVSAGRKDISPCHPQARHRQPNRAMDQHLGHHTYRHCRS